MSTTICVNTQCREVTKKCSGDYNLTIDDVVDAVLSEVKRALQPTNYVVVNGLYGRLENLSENVYKDNRREIVPMGCSYGCVYVDLKLL